MSEPTANTWRYHSPGWEYNMQQNGYRCTTCMRWYRVPVPHDHQTGELVVSALFDQPCHTPGVSPGRPTPGDTAADTASTTIRKETERCAHPLRVDVTPLESRASQMMCMDCGDIDA